MAIGGSKPGERRGGRQKGTPNKRTAAREQAMQEAAERISSTVEDAFEGDAHAFLILVYEDPAQPMDLRLDAAKAAVRFKKPSLASTTLKGDQTAPIGFVLMGVAEPASTAEWLAQHAPAERQSTGNR